LQKTYLDGAAFLYNQNPVVVYTGRYKRIDNFWFTIAHELSHVLLHLSKKNPLILDNFADDTKLEKIEKEANEMAAKFLLHKEIMIFLEDDLKYLTLDRIKECSATLKIHPSIIIGKLLFEKKIAYNKQSLYNENILDVIDEGYKY
jgi:HTH-type transcriptional regulator/antitoxin HigA